MVDLIIDKSLIEIYNINNEKSKKIYIRITLDSYLYSIKISKMLEKYGDWQRLITKWTGS